MKESIVKHKTCKIFFNLHFFRRFRISFIPFFYYFFVRTYIVRCLLINLLLRRLVCDSAKEIKKKKKWWKGLQRTACEIKMAAAAITKRDSPLWTTQKNASSCYKVLYRENLFWIKFFAWNLFLLVIIWL